MRSFIALLFCTILLYSCIEQKKHTAVLPVKTTVNKHWLDSIIAGSDSNSIKPYGRRDFVTAAAYFNKKDSVVCQVMRDSAAVVRQIIIAKKNVRLFFAQYYDNGQLQASLPLDALGQYDGKAAYYFTDGTMGQEGSYIHGFKQGKWKNFNNEGKLVATDEYNDKGQLVSSEKL
jgi:hypothetical protein